VDEVCLLWTCAGPPWHIAPKGVDVVDYFDGCNAQADCPAGAPCGCKRGELLDFSAARTRSFALASGELRTYLDTDDTIEGAGDLRDLYKPDVAVFSPYAYAFDELGRCTHRHYGPRVVDVTARWSYPVHNVLRVERVTSVEHSDAFTWLHHRTPEGNAASGARALRMLQHWQATPCFQHDARFAYYLGRAFLDVGKRGRASTELERAFELETFRDQKCNIALDLARCFPPAFALVWAHHALEIRPDWPAPWCMLARLYYRIGRHALARRFLAGAQDCAPAATALAVDPTETERTAAMLGLS